MAVGWSGASIRAPGVSLMTDAEEGNSTSDSCWLVLAVPCGKRLSMCRGRGVVVVVVKKQSVVVLTV